jgi:acyl-CoA thioesterase FadM
MEEAEHAMWREAGLSIAAPNAEVGFPRVAASFDYLKPLRFEEEFDLHLRVAAIGEKTIRYTCVLTRGDVRIAAGTTTVACVTVGPDTSMKAIPFPPEIASKFEVAAGADLDEANR